MKHNPDDRRDNAKKIQKHISDTIENIELAEEMIKVTSDSKTKEALRDKNARRRHALEGMRQEMKDETKNS